MTDRYNIHSQLEHLQSKYIGTGHADTSKWEWLVNQHRDSYCSYMGHFDLLNYFSVAENESKARVRFNLMEKMLQFDPRKRIDVVQALKHPWLAQLHDESAEPSAPGPFEFDFEDEQLNEAMVRELVFEEAKIYHP